MKNLKDHKVFIAALALIFCLATGGWADSTDPLLEKAAALKC